MADLPPYDLLRTAVREWLSSRRWGTMDNPFSGAIPKWRKFLMPHYHERYGDAEKAPSIQLLYAIFYGTRGMPEDLYGLMIEDMQFKCPWWYLRPIDPCGFEHKESKETGKRGVRQSFFKYTAKSRREIKQ